MGTKNHDLSGNHFFVPPLIKRTGYSVGGGTLFIHIKVAQWCIEAKMAQILGT